MIFGSLTGAVGRSPVVELGIGHIYLESSLEEAGQRQRLRTILVNAVAPPASSLAR